MRKHQRQLHVNTFAKIDGNYHNDMIKAMKLWKNTQLQQQDRTELIVWQQISKLKKR